MKQNKFKYDCMNVMGMPTDRVTCRECGATKQVFGMGTLSKMTEWQDAHKCDKLANSEWIAD